MADISGGLPHRGPPVIVARLENSDERSLHGQPDLQTGATDGPENLLEESQRELSGIVN